MKELRTASTVVCLATHSGTGLLVFYSVSLIFTAPLHCVPHACSPPPPLFPLINYRCRSITHPILNRAPRSSSRCCFTDFRKRTLWIPRRDRSQVAGYNYGRATLAIERKNRACTRVHDGSQGVVNKAASARLSHVSSHASRCCRKIATEANRLTTRQMGVDNNNG